MYVKYLFQINFSVLLESGNCLFTFALSPLPPAHPPMGGVRDGDGWARGNERSGRTTAKREGISLVGGEGKKKMGWGGRPSN